MKVNPWVECPMCKKIHNRSVVGFTFRCSCGYLIGETEIRPEPLETMPSWAQEIVYDLALGLVEDDNATWEWYKGHDQYVLIRSHGFHYVVSHTGIR